MHFHAHSNTYSSFISSFRQPRLEWRSVICSAVTMGVVFRCDPEMNAPRIIVSQLWGAKGDSYYDPKFFRYKG